MALSEGSSATSIGTMSATLPKLCGRWPSTIRISRMSFARDVAVRPGERRVAYHPGPGGCQARGRQDHPWNRHHGRSHRQRPTMGRGANGRQRPGWHRGRLHRRRDQAAVRGGDRPADVRGRMGPAVEACSAACGAGDGAAHDAGPITVTMCAVSLRRLEHAGYQSNLALYGNTYRPWIDNCSRRA